MSVSRGEIILYTNYDGSICPAIANGLYTEEEIDLSAFISDFHFTVEFRKRVLFSSNHETPNSWRHLGE